MPLIICCTAALASLSDSISYITYLFSEWRIQHSTNMHSERMPKVDVKLRPLIDDYAKGGRPGEGRSDIYVAFTWILCGLNVCV